MPLFQERAAATPLLPEDITQICPYDRSHEILVERFAKHLDKCRRAHPNSGLQICRFNWTHHVPKEEIAAHEKQCGKTDLLLRKSENVKLAFEIPDPNANARNAVFNDPDWDEEVAPYDPELAAKNKDVIRNVYNLPKSARLAHRETERVRLANLAAVKNEIETKSEQPKTQGPRVLRRPRDMELSSSKGRGELRSSIKALTRTPSMERKLTTGASPYDQYIREEIEKKTENFEKLRL